MIDYVWIVEMFNDAPRRKRWEPTYGMRLTKEEALAEMKLWQSRNLDDCFRVRRYVAVEERE